MRSEAPDEQWPDGLWVRAAMRVLGKRHLLAMFTECASSGACAKHRRAALGRNPCKWMPLHLVTRLVADLGLDMHQGPHEPRAMWELHTRHQVSTPHFAAGVLAAAPPAAATTA